MCCHFRIIVTDILTYKNGKSDIVHRVRSEIRVKYLDGEIICVPVENGRILLCIIVGSREILIYSRQFWTVRMLPRVLVSVVEDHKHV